MRNVSREAAAILEQRMQDTFGYAHQDYLTAEENNTPVPNAYLSNAIRIIDRSGIIDDLKRAHTRKSNAGRKADIPAYAFLVLLLMNVQLGKGGDYAALANTVRSQLTPEQCTRLGITRRAGDRTHWYHRVWRAAERLVTDIDPYEVRHDRRLEQAENEKFWDGINSEEGAKTVEAKLAYLDSMMEKLIHASVRVLPKDIWGRYHGNVAIDATFIETCGGLNPMDPRVKRGSADPFAGRYRRTGDHDGSGASTDKSGYELEDAVMAWNRPGENTLFPSLTTAVKFHRPGEVKGQGLKLVTSHEKLGFTGGLLLADRAYNNSVVELFHIPLRLRGWELSIDYKANDLGLQAQYKDLILVDGNWFVTWMPQDLIDAAKNYKTLIPDPTGSKKEVRLLDEKTYQKYIKARTPYRMTPKGRPDKDGYQRFSYPKQGSYMAIDRATGKRVKPTTQSSITIPLDAGDTASTDGKTRLAVKHLQKYAYGTDEYRAHYGMRNLVESSHNLLKHPKREDLANKSKRPKRGYAFQYLVATLAVVSSNLRRIVRFFEATAQQQSQHAPQSRLRRRANARGDRLPKSKESRLATAPPE